MDTIGLVGVGYIGGEFLERLLAADYDVVAFDIDDEAVERVIERGGVTAASPTDVASQSEAVVLALPGSPEVEATLEGTDGLLDGLDPDQLVVDATTTHPDTSVVAAKLCDEAGAVYLEAPITGGAPREGYQMMVGGTQSRYERAEPLLDSLCDAHTRVGAIPDGTVLKLGLQMRYAGRAALDAEIVEFTRDNDVDPALYRDFFGMGVWDRYLTGDFKQSITGLGGRAIWHKDIGYARQFVADSGTALPLTAVVHEAYRATDRRSADEDGHAAALIGYWMALNAASDRYE